MLAAAKSADVTPGKMADDPQHGLLISASGVRKMAARAADTRAKLELLQLVEQIVPRQAG